MKPQRTDERALFQIPRCFVMAYPSQARAGGATTIGGQSVAILDPAVPAGTAWPLLSLSFEDAHRGLDALAGVFLEPDGSFTLTAVPEVKLEGQLNDEGRALAHVELWGICRLSDLTSVLSVLGWPAQQVVFLLAEAGVYVSEGSFWQFIQRDPHDRGDG